MNTPKGQVKILLVDDSPEWRKYLVDNLQRYGYLQIQEAPNGSKALDLGRSYEPNLVFMDTEMLPPPFGPEVCARMRQEDYGKRAAIIGMSNNRDSALRDAWLNAGADDFMGKTSMDGETLDAKIQEMLAIYPQ